MWTRPESDEALVRRFLPGLNPDREDRARAWAEWQLSVGETAVLKFIRIKNNTSEPDEDILQEAMLTAYLEVERGNYESRAGVPFTAYVKGIARNKIRAARRRDKRWTSLEEIGNLAVDAAQRQLESAVERREQHERLHLGLGDLPPQRRQVIERFLFGESTTEIAAGLAITKDLVRQHKSRGLRALRQMNRLDEREVANQGKAVGVPGRAYEVPARPGKLTSTSD
jgi:RNA polymerase sigma factor (sigma-70 family)